MANFKLGIITFLIILLTALSVSSTNANSNIPIVKSNDYEAIYNSLEEADFDYLFGIDPYQAEEYKVYMRSPYPLFRSGVNLVFKTKTIPAGYYLLTPREKNGKTYILFKENGRVSYTIPVYKEDIITNDFYKEKLPQEKLNPYEKTKKKTMNFIGKKWGKRNQRTPIPNAYIEFDDAGDYWSMILYYETKKYYLIFKKDN